MGRSGAGVVVEWEGLFVSWCIGGASLGKTDRSRIESISTLLTLYASPPQPPLASPRYPQLMQALMTRFGGHPYDEMDLLPFNVVDPVKRTPLENLWGMGYNRNELVGSWRGAGGDDLLCL